MGRGTVGLVVGIVVGALGTATVYEARLGGTNSAFGNMVREQLGKTGMTTYTSPGGPNTVYPPTPNTVYPPSGQK